jgi:hypothetical protein
MLPPLTDLVALMGIALVVCSGCLRLLDLMRGGSGVAGITRSARSAKWATAICFVVLWCPVGAAQLPLVAYIRGISSDLSITLVALACLNLLQRLWGPGSAEWRERMAVSAAVAVAALVLYPLALGWGDWDVYRVGWGAPGMWVGLLILSLFCWAQGLRLVPILVALALLAWRFGILESSNLWDYLMDPWLAFAALFQCVKWGAGQLLARFRRGRDRMLRSSSPYAPAAQQSLGAQCIPAVGADIFQRLK